MSLEEARKKINALDAELVRLLDERARVGREIGAIKAQANAPAYQPDRERAVLESLAQFSDGGMPEDGLENIFRAIMKETRELQGGATAAAPCSGHCAAPGSGKIDVESEVVENVEAAPGFWRMRLRSPRLGGLFQPGQFFQLRIGQAGEGAFLRRPFAPSEYTADGLAFIYADVGKGTDKMTRLPVGAKLSVIAPLGHGYTVEPGMSAALLVGGGCGAPSLAPLACHLRDIGVRTTVVLGAKTAATLLDHGLFSKVADRLIIATDDGSKGCKGTVVDAYRIEKNIGEVDFVYSCGPMPMLRAIGALAAELGVRCEVSLEERMACGFGACMGCVVPIRAGASVAAASSGSVYKRVCHDGPVFAAEAVAWEEMR